MSNRAEGCGQWLSANTKRRETKLAPLQGGKTKKTKKKKNFSNLAPRLIVQISSSPLSPRTVKKLRNAKQTKLNRFFKVDGRPNSNGCLKNNSAASNREDDLEKKQAKIPVKRHRDNSSSGCSTDIFMTDEQLIDSQENEDHNSTELNISGISHLSDRSDIHDDHSENDFPLRSEPDNDRAFFEAHTLTPPTKKQRTLNSDASFEESNSKDRADSLSLEQEPSQSFHFSQWKKDQMAKCKEIQDRDFTEYSFYNHAGSITSAGRECCHNVDHCNVGETSSETPPFEFTQWEKQQIEECSKIQKETYPPEITPQTSFNSSEQSDSLKFSSRNLTSQAYSEFNFSEWAKNQIKLCRNLQQTGDTGGIAWVDENWDEWIYTAGKMPCTSQLHSEESQFKFSQWMKKQMRKCRNIQENSE